MRKSVKWTDIIIFILFAGFFGAIFVIGEPVYTGDTYQYECQMVMREPGYSLLMQGSRFLCATVLSALFPGEDGYYHFIILFQNILAVITNTVFVSFISKRYKLNIPFTLLAGIIMLAPHIMTPVFASTNLILTNSLMTEGVIFSLYPLFIMGMIKSIDEAFLKSEPFTKTSIFTVLLGFLMTLIRGQMMVLIIVWFIVMVCLVLFEKNDERLLLRLGKSQILKVFAIVFIVLLTFVVRIYTVRAYNYIENGLFVDTASGKAMSFANILYVTDREDGQAIEDKELRELFYQMYDSAYNNEMNYKFAPEGMLAREAYFEKCHDELNFTYFGGPAKQYVENKTGITVEQYQELMIEIDKIADKLSGILMPKVLKRYVSNYIDTIIVGFVRTVAYPTKILVFYSIFIYVSAIILTLFILKKDRCNMAAIFMLVVLLCIAGNVTATALMIQCISRYMIYNLPLFYIAGVLEFIEIYRITADN